MASPQSTPANVERTAEQPVELAEQIVAELRRRVQATEALGNTAKPEDVQDLNRFKTQLTAEEKTLTDWRQFYDSAPLPSGVPSGSGVHAVVIHGNPGIYEKAWSSVFEFYPGLRARFQEIVSLDQREEQLFGDRYDPNLRPIWLQTNARVFALWDPFKQEVTSKLEFLRTDRRFTVRVVGEVWDDDDLSSDEHIDVNEGFPRTLKFGEAAPLIKTYSVNNEIKLNINVTCRLEVGAENGPPVLNIKGNMKCFDGDEEQGSADIDIRISPGQTSEEFQAGASDDDYGKVRFSFDLAP